MNPPPAPSTRPTTASSTHSHTDLNPRLSDRFKHLGSSTTPEEVDVKPNVSPPRPPTGKVESRQAQQLRKLRERPPRPPVSEYDLEEQRSNARGTGVRNCEGCRSRKQRCDRSLPCSSCSLRGLDCVYASGGPIGLTELEANQAEIVALRRRVSHLVVKLDLSDTDLSHLSRLAAVLGEPEIDQANRRRQKENGVSATASSKRQRPDEVSYVSSSKFSRMTAQSSTVPSSNSRRRSPSSSTSSRPTSNAATPPSRVVSDPSPLDCAIYQAHRRPPPPIIHNRPPPVPAFVPPRQPQPSSAQCQPHDRRPPILSHDYPPRRISPPVLKPLRTISSPPRNVVLPGFSTSIHRAPPPPTSNASRPSHQSTHYLPPATIPPPPQNKRVYSSGLAALVTAAAVTERHDAFHPRQLSSAPRPSGPPTPTSGTPNSAGRILYPPRPPPPPMSGPLPPDRVYHLPTPTSAFPSSTPVSLFPPRYSPPRPSPLKTAHNSHLPPRGFSSSAPAIVVNPPPPPPSDGLTLPPLRLPPGEVRRAWDESSRMKEREREREGEWTQRQGRTLPSLREEMGSWAMGRG